MTLPTGNQQQQETSRRLCCKRPLWRVLVQRELELRLIFVIPKVKMMPTQLMDGLAGTNVPVLRWCQSMTGPAW